MIRFLVWRIWREFCSAWGMMAVEAMEDGGGRCYGGLLHLFFTTPLTPGKETSNWIEADGTHHTHRRYADHIGIHHFLCQKLREFSYPEIEFFLPQLCHLLVSIEETESVALEEFIFELCEKSAHGALLVCAALLLCCGGRWWWRASGADAARAMMLWRLWNWR